MLLPLGAPPAPSPTPAPIAAQKNNSHMMVITPIAVWLPGSDSQCPFASYPLRQVFKSEPQNYRNRAEFRVWHEGDSCYFIMFERVRRPLCTLPRRLSPLHPPAASPQPPLHACPHCTTPAMRPPHPTRVSRRCA